MRTRKLPSFLALSALAMFAAGCPELWQSIPAAVECTADLVAAVTKDIDKPDWNTRLDDRAKAAGVSAIACALGKVLGSLAHGVGAGGSSLVSAAGLVDPTQVTRRARAQAWLDVNAKPAP